MQDHALLCYASPERHAAISDIIRRRSSHRDDVRDVALAGLDLSQVHRVLDLGCGFGFMTARLLPRLAADALVLGVDAWPENREPFVEAVTDSGRRPEFCAMRIETHLPWVDRSFDLVLASYSLYFFPAILRDIVRLLRPQGRFLTVAHSEESFRSLYEIAGVVPKQTPLFRLLRNFSAENGEGQLRQYFREIERIDYRNELRFTGDQLDDLGYYLRCKIPLLLPTGGRSDELPARIQARLMAQLARHACFVIEKDDAIFRCQQPVPPASR